MASNPSRNQQQQVTRVQLMPLVRPESSTQSQLQTDSEGTNRRSKRTYNENTQEASSEDQSSTKKVVAGGGGALFLLLVVGLFLVKVLVKTGARSASYSGSSSGYNYKYDSSPYGGGMWKSGSTYNGATQPPTWKQYDFGTINKLPTVPNVGTCSNSACTFTVRNMLNSRNESIDPCDNFYEYACRGWQNNNNRPNYLHKWSTFSKLSSETSNVVRDILASSSYYTDSAALRQAKSFYRSCTNVGSYKTSENSWGTVGYVNDTDAQDAVALEPMWNTLENYGGWPILYQGSWQDSQNYGQFNWMKSVVDLRRLLGRSEILDINSYQSPDGEIKNNTIFIRPPSAASGSRNGLIQLKELQTAIKSLFTWKDLIVNISRELLIRKGVENINDTYLEERALDILYVQSALLDLEDNQKNSTETIGIGEIVEDEIPLNRLQKIVNDSLAQFGQKNEMNLKNLLKLLYANTAVHILDTENVFVSNMNYLLAVSKFVTFVKPEALANYLHFKMALEMASMTTRNMQGFLNTLKNTLYGTSGEKPKSSVCTDITQEKYALVISQAYMNRRYLYPADMLYDVGQIRTMFSNVKKSISKLIEATKLPFYNKTILAMKVAYTDICIAVPSLVFDQGQVQMEYYGLHLNKSEPFLEQYKHVTSWFADKKLQTLREPLDIDDECKWTRSAGTVGAYNEVARYLIYLPLGIMQPPFYNLDFTNVMKYAKLGTILGHELVHGLTGLGWTKNENNSLTPTAECFVRQYSNYTTAELKDENITLNGELTLAENIPDNVGLLGAYQAYKNLLAASNLNGNYNNEKKSSGLEKYSDSQLFFLGFAQNFCETSTPEGMRRSMRKEKHSPDMFRVLGTLKNSKEFSQAWNCPAGSNMNPVSGVAKKCSMF